MMIRGGTRRRSNLAIQSMDDLVQSLNFNVGINDDDKGEGQGEGGVEGRGGVEGVS